LKAIRDEWKAEMMACLGKTEATDLETNSEMIQPVGEHQEVPKEQSSLETGRAPKKKHKSRCLASERRQKPKEGTRGNCGFRKRLAVAGRKMISWARVAWRMKNFVRKIWTKDKVERGTRRVRTLRKRLRTRLEGRIGIKDLGGRRPLYLRKEKTATNSIGGRSAGQPSLLGSGGTLKKALYEIVSVKIAKQKAGSSAASQKIKD
jgi:hypothetical protein